MMTALSDLDLRLIRVFLAVVRADGITNAQPTLNVGQSTISTQISTLEVRLGYRLCERGRSGFYLTEKGRRFYELCTTFVESVDQFTNSARHLDRVLVGTLNVGLVDHAPPEVTARISEAIALFKNRDEAVRFTMHVGTPAQLEEKILSGELDLGIGYFWHRVHGLTYTPLVTEKQIAFCGTEHPLFARAGRLSGPEVKSCEWIWRTFPVPETAFAVPHSSVTAHADNLEAVIAMIMSGRHLGFLPEHYAQPYETRGLIRALNPNTLTFTVQLHTVAKLETGEDPILAAFKEDLTSVSTGLLDLTPAN